MDVLAMYYAQKDGCKKHGDGHGKICLRCVDDEVNELRSRNSALVEGIRQFVAIIVDCHSSEELARRIILHAKEIADQIPEALVPPDPQKEKK